MVGSQVFRHIKLPQDRALRRREAVYLNRAEHLNSQQLVRVDEVVPIDGHFIAAEKGCLVEVVDRFRVREDWAAQLTHGWELGVLVQFDPH